MTDPFLEVEGRDNRGTADHPYGFIYFNDSRRVVYAGTTVHDGTGGWPEITSQHRELAQKYLNNQNKTASD